MVWVWGNSFLFALKISTVMHDNTDLEQSVLLQSSDDKEVNCETKNCIVEEKDILRARRASHRFAGLQIVVLVKR